MNTSLVILFATLAVCLVIGIPVAYSIGISCMALLLFEGYPPLDIIVQRATSGAKSFSMMAMPMFIFAGSLMVYGSTPRLMRFANMMLRRLPGALERRLWLPAVSLARYLDPVLPVRQPLERLLDRKC